MKWVGCLGAVVILLSAWLQWIVGPMSRGPVEVPYAWMVIVAIGGLGLVACWMRADRCGVACGVAGLGVCSFVLLYLTFVHPAFWALVEENAQYVEIMRFTRRHFPSNLGVEPTLQTMLPADTLLERLGTAWYFMGKGWWIGLLGSVVLLGSCGYSGGRQTWRWLSATALIVCVGQSVFLVQGVVAQNFWEQGDRHMADGNYGRALGRYDAAQQMDTQLARSVQRQLRIGEAHVLLGVPTQLHARFYLGHRYTEQGNIDAALSEYRLALPHATGALESILRKRLAWTYVTLGFKQYRQGDVGQAAVQWEKALATDSAQIAAVYGLARAYFDQGRYEQSLAMSQSVLAYTRHRLLRANVQANMGDSYWKLGDTTKARLAYAVAMKLDAYGNFRAMKSLGGT